MTCIAGVDGCRAGWITVCREIGDPQLKWKRYRTLSEFLTEVVDIKVVGIDIPIGLPEKGSRYCDIEARRLLGNKRGSSVFPAPIRAVLNIGDYRLACRTRHMIEGKKMSQQAWAIVPKIKEVDSLLYERPVLSALLYEVHPEVSFYFMGNRNPNKYSKKKKLGIEERIEKLSPHFEIDYHHISEISGEYEAQEMT